MEEAKGEKKKSERKKRRGGEREREGRKNVFPKLSWRRKKIFFRLFQTREITRMAL